MSTKPLRCNRPPIDRRYRNGKILVMLLVLLPGIFGIAALVFDSGWLFSEARNLQHAADAAALSAATELRLGHDEPAVRSAAEAALLTDRNLSDASVQVHWPPQHGVFSGDADYVEVIAERELETFFRGITGEARQRTSRVRSVAGIARTTPGAAIVVLDPEPVALSVPSTQEILNSLSIAQLATEATQQSGVGTLVSGVPLLGATVAGLLENRLDQEITASLDSMIDSINDSSLPTLLPALPTLVAGMEVEGLGRLIVDGSIHVNTMWGQFDESWQPAGVASGPPYGLACMPVVSTTRVAAHHIRVAGGVDRPNHYSAFESGGEAPLRAGRLPVPDPYETLSFEPTPISDASHVTRVTLSSNAAQDVIADIANQLTPLLQPLLSALLPAIETELTQVTLSPGTYESITVIAPAGGVTLLPGTYVIQGRNPITQISLCLVGPIHAEGVMFYLADPNGDDASGELSPPAPIGQLVPSVVIAPLLPGGRFSGLASPDSDLDEMLIYQARSDRRPLLIEAQHLLGTTQLSGTLYAKWGHVSFLGGAGQYDARIVAGTVRVVTVGETTFSPTRLMPAAQDVVLVE